MLKADESVVDACLELAAIDDARGRLKDAFGWLDAPWPGRARDQRPFAAKVELLMRRGQPVEVCAAAMGAVWRARARRLDALVLAAALRWPVAAVAAARPWLIAASSSAPTPPQWLVARLLVNARDYQAASDLLDKALQSQPGSIALRRQGRDRSAPRAPDVAEQRARQVAKDRPNDPQAQSPLGQVGVVMAMPRSRSTPLRKAHATAPTSETLLRPTPPSSTPRATPAPACDAGAVARQAARRRRGAQRAR